MPKMTKRTQGVIFGVVFSICILAVILALAITLALRDTSTDYALVKTECGYVQGKKKDVTTDSGSIRTVREFLNIPYAAPPTGDLRWRAPVSLKQHGSCWNETLKYNGKEIMCVQPSNNGTFQIVGQEDCLILHIWSPISSRKKTLPVLVYIHGGGMIAGHSRGHGYYPDGQFTASMDVISVSINYRLNLFGFLSLEELWSNSTSGGYGNYGIMDQILALRWIKENIKSFGGDPNDVTIFGHSGGATAVYCLLSASLGLAKGLFHKMIAASGAPNVHTTHIEANKLYRPLIKSMGCTRNNSNDVQACLRSLDAQSIMRRNLIHISSLHLRDYTFVFPENVNRNLSGFPLQIIDPLVVKYSPSRLLPVLQSLPAGNQLKLDILMGNMAQEPNFLYAPRISWTYEGLKEYLEPKVDTFKVGLYPRLLDQYKNISRDRHISPASTPYHIYSVMTADIMLSCATTQMAYDLSAYSSFKVYSYMVSQGITSGQGGAAEHGMDTLTLFGFGVLPGKITSEDLMLKKNIRDIVKRFIYSESGFEQRYRSRTMEFWNSTVLRLSQPYHEEECKILRENGFLKHTWGNMGWWD